jgi:hypothetical protein
VSPAIIPDRLGKEVQINEFFNGTARPTRVRRHAQSGQIMNRNASGGRAVIATVIESWTSRQEVSLWNLAHRKVTGQRLLVESLLTERDGLQPGKNITHGARNVENSFPRGPGQVMFSLRLESLLQSPTHLSPFGP